jgi:hypothetical protein
VNPYHLVIVYWRSAFAELLAACLVPLVVLLVLKAAEDKRAVAIPLGMVLAGSWLTNAPAAVMIHYSLTLLVVFFAWRQRSVRILWTAAVAVALGACLASVYLLPAIYEQRWIDIGEAISPGSRPQDNFLFIHTADVTHDAFNRIISWVAILETAVIVAAAFAAKVWHEKNRSVFDALLVWAAVCSFLLFPISLPFWRILPKLQYMQFPWRWLLCLSVMFTILVAAGLRRWWMRAVICAITLVVIVLAWNCIQAPWWDNAADLREMQDNMYTRAGYEGTDEYTPQGADPSVIDKNARNVTVDGPARGAIHVYRWDPEYKLFTAEVSAKDQLALRLFPYPAWRVEVNGHAVETAARAGSGQMLVPVEAGMNRIQIRFVRTWDRTLGGWISVLAVVGLAGWTGWNRTRRMSAGSFPDSRRDAGATTVH